MEWILNGCAFCHKLKGTLTKHKTLLPCSSIKGRFRILDRVKRDAGGGGRGVEPVFQGGHKHLFFQCFLLKYFQNNLSRKGVQVPLTPPTCKIFSKVQIDTVQTFIQIYVANIVLYIP